MCRGLFLLLWQSRPAYVLVGRVRRYRSARGTPDRCERENRDTREDGEGSEPGEEPFESIARAHSGISALVPAAPT